MVVVICRKKRFREPDAALRRSVGGVDIFQPEIDAQCVTGVGVRKYFRLDKHISPDSVACSNIAAAFTSFAAQGLRSAYH